MSHIKKISISLLLCFIIFIISFPIRTPTAKAFDSLAFVLLSQYQATMDIGDECYLVAITSDGNFPTWKSSNSSIASVNTYGLITAKKSGNVKITAKIKNAEASCKLTVLKTKITLNKTSSSLERNATLKLNAVTSNNSNTVWKSSKSSVATVDEDGLVTAIKPGETIITATADQSSATCKIKVKSPSISLDKTKITLFRGGTAKLFATVSSGVDPGWKTNKKSVATVDANGNVTALKHGMALITATVDGVSKSCEVTVEQPTVVLSSGEVKLKKGESYVLTATVSSGNQLVWSSSNSNVAIVDSGGRITALQKGRAYIYAAEDGVKVRCTVSITE